MRCRMVLPRVGRGRVVLTDAGVDTECRGCWRYGGEVPVRPSSVRPGPAISSPPRTR